MKLDGSYEFSELTQIEGIFVSSGREKATGKIIQIHLFPGGKSDVANRICQQLISLPDEARSKILKYGQEGSASYFVTEPLPKGEFLQSWVERLSRPEQPTSAPKVSPGLTDQLRQMGIAPAPLAPAIPVRESPNETGDMTREFRSLYGQGQASEPTPEPFPAKAAPGLDTFLGLHPAPPGGTPKATPVVPFETPPPPGASSAESGTISREFHSLYRERPGDAEMMPAGFHEVAQPGPSTADTAPGLRTWAGLKPDPAPASPKVIRPPLSAPLVSFEEPARPEPVVSLDPTAIPILEHRQEPYLQNVPAWKRPTVAPVRVPIAANGAQRSSPGNLDWKTVVLVVVTLLAVAALVIAIVENSG